MIGTLIRKVLDPIASRLFPVKWKEYNELRFWKSKKSQEGRLRHDHYEYFYTEHFGLTHEDYAGKRVLDIGCGPRGSLEWADMAERRVGLDPLADEYLRLGADEHEMEYVTGSSEDMPFPTDSFDIVCSMNSLDHVADLDRTVAEIKRVLKPSGLFLLITELGHEATPQEPQEFSWDVIDRFAPEMKLLRERRYEKSADGIYPSIRANEEYDTNDSSSRCGILSAKFEMRS